MSERTHRQRRRREEGEGYERNNTGEKNERNGDAGRKEGEG
jgi:hypothetical protein